MQENELVRIKDLQEFETRITALIEKSLSDKPSGQPKKLLRTKEVREKYHIPGSTLQLWRDKGRVKFTQNGRVIWYDEESIKAATN